MLNKQDQLRYLDRALDSLTKILTGFSIRKPGKKEVHDLRVDIKKIKALIELNKINGFRPGSTGSVALSLLFRDAGEIRNSQIILDNLDESGIHEKRITDQQKTAIRNATKRIREKIPWYLEMINQFRKEMTTSLSTISKSDLANYQKLKNDFINGMLTAPLNPDLLHEARKQIKHLFYIREMIRPSAPKLPAAHYTNMNKLQDLIGKWHDAVGLIEFLDGYDLKGKNKIMENLNQKKYKLFKQLTGFTSK